MLVQCSYGNKCLFGHGLRDRRRDPLSHVYAPIMCPEAIADGTLSCKAGDACPFAHTPIELRAHPLVLLRELKAGKSPELMRLTQQAPGENGADSPGRGRRGRFASGGVAAATAPSKVQVSLAAMSGSSVSVVVAVDSPPQQPPQQHPRHGRSGGAHPLPSAAYPMSSPTCQMCNSHPAHGMVNSGAAPSFNPYAGASPADVMVHPHLYISPHAVGQPQHRQPPQMNGVINRGATPPASPMHPPLPAGPPPPESYAARDADSAAPRLPSSPPPPGDSSTSEPASPRMLAVVPRDVRSNLPEKLFGYHIAQSQLQDREGLSNGEEGEALPMKKKNRASQVCGTMAITTVPPGPRGPCQHAALSCVLRRPSGCAASWRRPSKRTPSARPQPTVSRLRPRAERESATLRAPVGAARKGMGGAPGAISESTGYYGSHSRGRASAVRRRGPARAAAGGALVAGS